MYLGFDDHFYQIYEGSGSKYGHVLLPAPLIVPVHLLSNNEDTSSIPSHIGLQDAERIFREDSFDPITRIRRGRMYEKDTGGQPQQWSIPANPAMPPATEDRSGYPYTKPFQTFRSFRLSTQFINPSQLPTVVMGCGEALSQWRIIGIERGVFGEDLITLRAITNMGLLPELNTEVVPELGKAKVEQCLEAVVDTAYRTGPESVIDRCRDFAVSMLAAFLAERNPKSLELDLSELAKKMDQDVDGKKNIVINSAYTLAKLHSRAKPNAEARYKAPPIYEQDAELAIQCAGVIMRDLGFAVL